jgi:hypothetical protein
LSGQLSPVGGQVETGYEQDAVTLLAPAGTGGHITGVAGWQPSCPQYWQLIEQNPARHLRLGTVSWFGQPPS